MKTGRFLINPGRAIAFAAFLAFPIHSFAQPNAGPYGGRAANPDCVYKGVMSDAEIENCTGYRVLYNYAVVSGDAYARTSDRVVVHRTTNTGPASRESYPRAGVRRVSRG